MSIVSTTQNLPFHVLFFCYGMLFPLLNFNACKALLFLFLWLWETGAQRGFWNGTPILAPLLRKGEDLCSNLRCSINSSLHLYNPSLLFAIAEGGPYTIRRLKSAWFDYEVLHLLFSPAKCSNIKTTTLWLSSNTKRSGFPLSVPNLQSWIVGIVDLIQ